MEGLYPFVGNLDHISASVIDAGLVTVILSLNLWWFIFKPLKLSADAERRIHQAIKESVVEAIIALDRNGIILMFNTAAQEIFGYSSSEISGKAAALVFNAELLTPESLARLAGAEGIVQHTHEVICNHKEGHLLNLEMTVSSIHAYETDQFLVVMRDMTVRKKAEADLRESELRFRQIFDQSDDAILFLHPESSAVMDLNATATDLFGYGKEEVRSSGIALLCNMGCYESFSGFVKSIKLGGVPVLERFACRRKDGTEIVLSVSCKVMTLQEGEIVYASFKDITNRIRMEEQALELQSRLIQTDKMTTLGMMVSGVAHEINNPNNSILLNARLLERVCEDALPILNEFYRENGQFQIGGLPFTEMEGHLPEIVAGVIDGTRRINSIVNDLKTFVKIRPANNSESVNINKAVQGAVSILHYEIARMTSNFHLELCDSVPLLNGNSQHLSQVVINLLLNACQSLPSPQCGIWLSTAYDEVNAEISIIVRDEGVGIPPEIGKRILEPFFTTRVDSGGTGLGLSVSNSIVKEHHGTLDFSSVPGEGTTFKVKLPVVDDQAVEST